MTPRPTLVFCCISLVSLTCSNMPTHATPRLEETLTGNEFLAGLVGSWTSGKHKDDASCIRQECRWILNRKYLEIETFIDIKPHPTKTWKTLIAYDPTGNSYRPWNYADDGVVTAEQGSWDKRKQQIDFKGHTSTGCESISSLRLIKKDFLERDVSVYVDDDRDVLSGVAFTLERVSNTEAKQLPREALTLPGVDVGRD